MKTKNRDPISPKELTKSELRLLKWWQETIDVEKLYKKLIPSKDEHGLLRAHGRLQNIRTLPDEMRNPPEEPSISRTVARSATRKTCTLQLQEPHLRIKRAIVDCRSTSHGKTSILLKKNE